MSGQPEDPPGEHEYTMDAQGAIGVALGPKAAVIQNIGSIYQLHPAAPSEPRLAPTIRHVLSPLLDQHAVFGGRDRELTLLSEFLSTEPAGYAFVTGPSGFGKTALLANWTQILGEEAVAFHFITGIVEHADEEEFCFRNLCQQLAAHHKLAGTLPTSSAELRALFGELLRIPAGHQARIVVLVDALDDAMGWSPGLGMFPTSLPNGVYVAFSAREIAGKDWIGSLGLNRSNVRTITLEGMGVGEIASLLRSVDSAAGYAEDAEFVRAAFETSQGDPFYLRFLVEDIGSGLISSVRDLEVAPKGLNEYLDQWWLDLSGAIGQAATKDLLGYLLVAKGRISRKDLVSISSNDALTSVVFGQARATLSRYLIGADESGFALCHPRFQQYVASVVTPDEQLPYAELLLDYCRRWRSQGDHPSPYALRYLPMHLAEFEEVDDLIDLARSGDFASAQALHLPDEVDLPATTVMSALRAAVRSNYVPAIVEFLLAHARARRLTDSPLLALREGQLNRAQQLADRQAPSTVALWYLLLVWESFRAGRVAEGEATLQRLDGQEIQPLSVDFEVFRELIVRPLIMADSVNLLERLLDESALEQGLDLAASRITKSSARELVSQLRTEVGRAAALEALAKHHKGAVDVEASVAALASKGDDWDWDRYYALEAVLDAMLAEGAVPEAMAITRAVSKEFRSRAVLKIALAQAESANLPGAIETALSIDDSFHRAQAHAGIAKAHAAAADSEAAGAQLAQMLTAVDTLDEESDRINVLYLIADTQAEIGDFPGALKTAERISDPAAHASALSRIAHFLASRGADNEASALFEQMLDFAQSIHDKSPEPFFADLAATQIACGYTAEARRSMSYLTDPVSVVTLLLQIAETQSQADDAVGERATLSDAIEAASGITDTWHRGTLLFQIAKRYIALGELSNAETMIYSMDRMARSQAVKAIAAAYVRRGDTSHASALVRSTLLGWEMESALVSLAAECGAARNSTAANHIVEGIDTSYHKARALAAIASACADIGAEADSIDYFGSALATAGRDGDASQFSGSLAEIACIQAKNGDVSGGRDTAATIERPDQHAEVLCTFAGYAADRGDMVTAVSLLSDAFDLVQPGSDPDACAVAMVSIAEAQWRVGKQADARASWSAARELARPIADAFSGFPLYRIAASEAGVGEVARATETAQAISAGMYGGWVRAAICTAYAQAGNLAGAIDALPPRDSGNDRRTSLSAIVEALVTIGDLNSASFAASMLEGEVPAEPGYDRDSGLKAVASLWVLAGDSEAASLAASQISSDSLREKALLPVVRSLARSGSLSKALELVNSFQAASTRNEARGDMAEDLARSNSLRSALDQLAKIGDDRGRGLALERVAKAAAEGESGFDMEVAGQLVECARQIPTVRARSAALGEIAVQLAKSGAVLEGLGTARAVVVDRHLTLANMAASIPDETRSEGLDLLLFECAEHIVAAEAACTMLARIHPDQAADVARTLVRVRDAGAVNDE